MEWGYFFFFFIFFRVSLYICSRQSSAGDCLPCISVALDVASGEKSVNSAQSIEFDSDFSLNELLMKLAGRRGIQLSATDNGRLFVSENCWTGRWSAGVATSPDKIRRALTFLVACTSLFNWLERLLAIWVAGWKVFFLFFYLSEIFTDFGPSGVVVLFLAPLCRPAER